MNSPHSLRGTSEAELREIWLQVDEPEVSWCQDKINDTDVKYIRADLIKSRDEELIKIISELDRTLDSYPDYIRRDDVIALIRKRL